MKKNCASSWLFTKDYTEMHRQKDIKNNLSKLRHVSTYLDHLQGVTEYK